MNPTPEQIAAQVALLVRTRPEARVIGMHTSGPWLRDAALKVNSQTLPVAYCTSALQMSAALVAHGPDDPPLIIMTPLEEHQLSLDVLARLAGRRLYRIDRWQMVRDLFCARDLDPRLLSHGWMADALLQYVPEGGYPPVASGWLDVDTVWTQLCQQYLGLASGRPDAVALVVWSLTESNVHRYTALSAALRTGLRQRVEETAGTVGTALLDALEAGYGTLLLPIGLACEILFAPEAGTHLGLAQARARLEPYVAGRMLSADVGHAWFAAAATALETLPAAEMPAWLERTEQFLADLKASEYGALSNILGSGFSQRLVQFASELQRWLRGKATLDQVENSFDHACLHRETTRQGARLERVRMALRLARYLGTVQTETRLTTLAQAAVGYAAQGGYVDWARRYLIGGDEIKELATAFSALCKRVQQVREQQNKQFATLLATWHTTPRTVAEFIPIEQTLSRIVGTLARATPVLLLVIDGMGYAVFGELRDDLSRHGWVALTDQPGRALPALMSVVPSVTELSRASLLAGSLTRGNSAAEKQRFATHADLLAVSRPGSPPLLFHKGDLAEGGATELSAIVREAMRDGHRKIVGVVINAVDDHLAKSDQLRLTWTINQLQYLDALLYEAQLARRAVVITSDHGHVLEAGSKKLAGDSEERWRPYDTTLAAEELVFEGPRVAQATGMQRLIVPWSETVRYANKKQGYHGGATLQEVLVPIGVFVTPDRAVEGWEALPEHTPAWWSRAEEQSAAPTAPPCTIQQFTSPEALQGSLFTVPGQPESAPPRVDWSAPLLSSPVFTAQRRMAGRMAPDDRVVTTFLRAMEARHNRISRHMLAQELGQPELRLRGLLVGLQRLLNVDGYQVVVVDEATGMVELNRTLLDRQFQSPM